MYWDGMDGWGGWMGAGWMMIFWVGTIGVGIWAIYRLTRGQRITSSPAPLQMESPLETLDRRFASGGIGIDEYSESRAQLESGVDNQYRHGS